MCFLRCKAVTWNVRRVPLMSVKYKNALVLAAVMVILMATYFYCKEQVRMKPFLQETDPEIHLLNYTLQLSPVKCPEGTQVVIIVTSSPYNFKSREGIRTTWGADASNSHIQCYFIVGTVPGEVNQKITSESHLYGDLIRYSFVDTYLNLTLKSVCLLRWVKDRCSNAHYVVKIDDDVFFNVTLLLKLLKEKGNDMLLIGNAITGNKSLRKVIDRFYVPFSEYPGKIFPAYLSGGCYVMSRNVALELLSASRLARFMRLEDVFITGVCRKISDLVLIHSDEFLIVYPIKPPCFRWSVIAMVVSGEFKNDMYDLYERRKVCPYDNAVT